MTDRHPHWIPKSGGAGPLSGAHPPFGASAKPGAGASPPVQPPAESAAEQYRAIAEVTADWAYALHIEPDGRAITDWMAPHVHEVTGFTPSDLGPVDAWLRMVHRDDRELMRSHLGSLQAGRADTVEYRVVTASGETRWVRDYARPLAKPEHGAVRVVGGVRDITARRQAELDRGRLLYELEQSQERLDALADSMSQTLRSCLNQVRDAVSVLESSAAAGEPDSTRVDEHVRRLNQVTAAVEDIIGRIDRLSVDGEPGTD
jgi:PAS domain S-box-containing protein